MKKFIFAILLMVLPILAKADAVEINGIYYNLINKGKVAEVTSNPEKYSGAIIIPSTLIFNGVVYDVASIGENAFYDCSGLTSVEIPNSVTIIEAEAFWIVSKRV